MKVKDLMVKLSLMDPDMDVMLDKTPDNADMFKFETPVVVEETELEDGSKFVCIGGAPYEDYDINQN